MKKRLKTGESVDESRSIDEVEEIAGNESVQNRSISNDVKRPGDGSQVVKERNRG